MTVVVADGFVACLLVKGKGLSHTALVQPHDSQIHDLVDLDLRDVKEGVGKTAPSSMTLVAPQLLVGRFLVLDGHAPTAAYYNADLLLERLDHAHRNKPVDGIIFICDVLGKIGDRRYAHVDKSLNVEKNEALRLLGSFAGNQGSPGKLGSCRKIALAQKRPEIRATNGKQKFTKNIFKNLFLEKKIMLAWNVFSPHQLPSPPQPNNNQQ
jgi:hypothetical protein